MYLFKGEKSLSAEMEINYFYHAVALWKHEISNEKHEEIRRSSDSLFKKNFKGLWAATFLLKLLEGSCQESKITGTPAEAGDVSPLVHRSLEDQFVSLMVTEERAKFSADYQRLFVLIDHNKETV